MSVPEKTVSRLTTISDRHRNVEIILSVLAAFAPRETYAVATKASPALIGEDFSDPLFFKGICAGIWDAIYGNERYFLVAAAEIEITDLRFSEPLVSFDQDEIAGIGAELRDMASEAFSSILAGLE